MRVAGLLNRGLLMLMAGHFTVDLYAGLLPVLYPLLREQFALDLGAIGLIATLFTTALSVSQPVFGLLVDRFGSRWLGPAA
ncbi:MAG TPA: MFS transporter, partial [Thermomicrobiales bacterium]